MEALVCLVSTNVSLSEWRFEGGHRDTGKATTRALGVLFGNCSLMTRREGKEIGGTLDTDYSEPNRSPCPQNRFFQMTLDQIGFKFEVWKVKEGIVVEKIITPPEPDEDEDEEKEKEIDTLPLFFLFSVPGEADNEFVLVRVIFLFQASEHFLIHPLKYRREKGRLHNEVCNNKALQSVLRVPKLKSISYTDHFLHIPPNT